MIELVRAHQSGPSNPSAVRRLDASEAITRGAFRMRRRSREEWSLATSRTSVLNWAVFLQGLSPCNRLTSAHRTRNAPSHCLAWKDWNAAQLGGTLIRSHLGTLDSGQSNCRNKAVIIHLLCPFFITINLTFLRGPLFPYIPIV